MKNKILIVGGAGYIGSHVAKEFFKNDFQVTVFDNLSTGLKENILEGINFIEGDINDYQKISNAVKGVDAVVHLAAFKAAGDSMINPEKYSLNNISGTINLINAVSEQGIKKIIFSSSAAVYGNPKYLPINEDHPTEPINFYGFTKLEIERILKWYDNLKGIKFAALRYFNAVGYDIDGQINGLEKNPANLLPIVMEAVTGQREKISVFGDNYETDDGSCVRDYIHVSDLANAHKRAFDYLDQERESLIVNLGTSNGISVFEIIEVAKKISGKEFQVEVVDRRLGDPDKLLADSTEAEKLLGWKVKYSDVETIIKTTLNVYDKKRN